MSDKKLTTELQSELLKIDSSVIGNIKATIDDGTVFLTGQLVSSDSKIIDKLVATLHDSHPELKTLAAVKVESGLSVVVDDHGVRDSTFSIDDERENPLDNIRPLFFGEMSIGQIAENPEHKRENWNTYQKIFNCIDVADFIAPIVLDRNFKVIDGNLRLSIAKELGKTKVLVVVLDAEGIRADFLRLVLNRSSEFQRWKYEEVDRFIDSVPQAQPLLEPLGFFGERILPESFFGQTVLEYRIHEDFKSQQSAYRQEEGLAKWAEIQRARILEEEERKKAKKKKPRAEAVSLFDLVPAEEDFIPTYDIKNEVQEHVLEMREVAGTITDNYDAKRRAEKEAKGQAWQTARRSPKKVIADLEAEAVAKATEAKDEDL